MGAQKVPTSDVRIAEGDLADFEPQEFDRHLEHCKLTSLGEYQLRYGGNKLGCERILDAAWHSNGFPMTVLRLPDVYGPYDNLGGFWEIVSAVEMRRPLPTRLQPGRRRCKNSTFSLASAEDVRDAIIACIGKGADVHGVVLNIAHEEAVCLRQAADLVASAMGETPLFDDTRNASFPSTDYGTMDVSRALRMLRPWRPTPMDVAVRRAVSWFLESNEHRRYHRLVHRELRFYDTEARPVVSQRHDVRRCWVGSAEKAALVRDGPCVLVDSLPDLTGQAVLDFMTRLMDQVGEEQVTCELQKNEEVESQRWPLRHLAGQLLPESEHRAAYWCEDSKILALTDLTPQMHSPLEDLREGARTRTLFLGGVGARTRLRRCGPSGFWDCALLGRRRWRFLSTDEMRVDGDTSDIDTFCCGPDVCVVQGDHDLFAPSCYFECEQTMGEAVIVPSGWWFQTYDDDRTLSIRATYGEMLSEKPPPSVVDAFEIVD